MRAELNVRIHPSEADMAAVIFPQTGGVEQLIVARYKFFPSLRIAPDPVGKSVFDCLLFLLCKGRLLFVQDSFLFPVGIFIRVIDTDIFQIECFLQNLIRIRPVCAVSDIGIDVMDTGCAFPGNPPLCRSRREIDLNIPLQVKRRIERLFHKLLNIVPVNPCGAEPHIYFRCIQIFRLRLSERFHIHEKIRIFLCRHLCDLQLTPHIAGKVFIRRLPSCRRLFRCEGIFKDYATQFLCDPVILAGCP